MFSENVLWRSPGKDWVTESGSASHSAYFEARKSFSFVCVCGLGTIKYIFIEPVDQHKVAESVEYRLMFAQESFVTSLWW